MKCSIALLFFGLIAASFVSAVEMEEEAREVDLQERQAPGYKKGWFKKMPNSVRQCIFAVRFFLLLLKQ